MTAEFHISQSGRSVTQRRVKEANGAGRDVAVLPPTDVLVVLVTLLLVIKSILVFFAPPTPDEAYYWLWGQHPALSYFDHPPMIAWTQRIAAALFGWNLFALRSMTIVSFAASLWILWYWSQELAENERPLRVFLGSVVVWLGMPVVMRFQSVAHPDHLLIIFGLLTVHFWALFLNGHDRRQPEWRYYYLGCVALGFAGLSKFNAVFIALGFAAWIFLSAEGRQLLRSPHLWFGSLIAIAMQTPVLVWNFENGWPSFAYNLHDRIGQSVHGGFAGNLLAFLVSSVFMVSPVLIPALYRFLTVGTYPIQRFGRTIFAVSSLTFVGLCVSNTILFYWNLAAYLGFLPVVLFFLRSRTEFRLLAVYGIWMGSWILLLFVVPAHKLAGVPIRDVDISYGRDQVGAIVEKEEARFGADLVITTDYRTASLLSFSLKRLDIGKIGKQSDQFDFWFDPALHKGANAIVLADDLFSEKDKIDGMFGRVTVLYEFTSRKFGLAMHKYKVIYAENMK